jgi:hypothetical protein
MTAQIIYGTDFRAKSNRDRAFWIGPDPFEMLAMTMATTALMGDAWLQSLALLPEDTPEQSYDSKYLHEHPKEPVA